MIALSPQTKSYSYHLDARSPLSEERLEEYRSDSDELAFQAT